MKPKISYDIQQDNAGNYRGIRTGEDGIRRAWDNPPCKTIKESRTAIREFKQQDKEDRRTA